MICGAGFMLIASLGLLRMPDLFNRMQAATKATTLGVLLTMLSAMIHFGTTAATTFAALIVLFLFVTAPVAAHALSRAAYHAGVPMWEGSIRDELAREGREGAEGQEGQEGA